MSRIARVVLEGIPYHITQRGNARQQVFFDGRDYQLYLDLLGERAQRAGLGVLAYCLMPNHVQLIVVLEGSIGRRGWPIFSEDASGLWTGGKRGQSAEGS